jgi:hypothetical protein
MNKHNLIASVAAVLLTATSLGAVRHNVNVQNAPATEINGSKVINLAPVQVRPDADTLRAAAMLPENSPTAMATLPLPVHAGVAASMAPLNLIGSQLAMPYYSFGNKFGRISKE